MSPEHQQQWQSPTSTSRVVQSQQQKPQFSSAPYPYASTHYVPTSQNPIFVPEQSQNNQCKSLNKHNYLLILSLYFSIRHTDNRQSSRGSTTSHTPVLSQTIAYHPSESINNPFVDRSLTIPPRNTTSSYRASWDPQPLPRATSNVQSSSIFGSNPFAANNPRPAQRSSDPPSPPEPSPRRNFVTSITAARSLEGDDRPIFGGSGGGRGGGGGSVAGRGRGRFAAMAPIHEQEPLTNSLERRGTFVLDEPTLPNLPQSGAQKPRDTVIVKELYNVRKRNRARTPVAFTINLGETSQS